MPAPILATKLFIPPHRPKVVLRPRLIERLNAGLTAGSRLTLISAAAGFGKTTLVSEWLAGCERPIAWLSLDEEDNDPIRFLAYLVAALQTLTLNASEGTAANVGAGVLAALQSAQPPQLEPMLTALLNEIARVPDDFILVLDDYHVIDAKPVDASTSVDQAITFLLEHLPPQMHLVMATREDPHLPLARLRARGQLSELRAADLRFTPEEAGAFLNQMMNLNLSVENIAALETRTEGWIAGLQLAALSIQGRSDSASFIQAFTGSHRFVLDYLVEEVLQRQPARVRSFLLQTAILDRLSGSVCDAVCSLGTSTGREDGRAMLETLERSNLFVFPLDDKRQWYRYHHLFADVLRARLTEEQPDQVSGLHRRASLWYEQNGLPSDAIHHALAAKDFERAAGLIELAWPTMDISYQSAAWLGWVKSLPDKLIRARPVLSVGYAWALLDGGELEACESRLQDAERWLETPSNEMIVVDKELFQSLPATIATARAYRALALGDIPGTVQYARQALDLAPEQDQIRRIQATSLLGLAQYTSGDLEAAGQSLAGFQANLRKAGEIQTATGITFILANIKMAQGRLHEAVSAYQQALQLAASQGEPMPIGTADLYRGLGELYCEKGDLETAAQLLLTGKKLGEQALLPGWQHRLCVAEARIKEVQGDMDGAIDLLNEAERLYIRSPLPDVRPIAALKARVWIRQGKLAEALEWARERSLSGEDDLSYLKEFEHITLARLFIARYKNDRSDASDRAALRLLDRLLQAAEGGGRMGSAIEILLLQAVAHQAQGHIQFALTPLERALALAGPEGYVQIFVDEGLPMEALLREAAQSGADPSYVSQLRAALAKPEGRKPTAQLLVEPLSERELEVLKLLRTELSGPEIARELIVSLNTLRTHTKNIFNKLGVNNRRAAVRQAEELDLF